MNILHVISSRRCGGAEKYLSVVAGRQQQEGHSVFFYRTSFPCFDQLVGSLATKEITTKIFNSVSPIHLFRLYRFIVANRIQIIHTHLAKASILGGIIGKIMQIPVIATVHGLNSYKDYRFCTRLIAVSNAVKAHLISTRAPEKKISVIYNGIEKPTKTLLSHTHNGIHFLFVGRLEVEKGLAFFLSELARFTDKQWHFSIVGSGSQENILRRLVFDFGIDERVTFAGFCPNPIEWFRKADIVVMPSIKEGFGLAAIEAFSCAVPVFASDAGGLPEIVSDSKNGFVFMSQNSESLNRGLSKVFEADLKEMGKDAYAVFLQKFDAHYMNQRILEEYERLITSSYNHS